MGIADPGTVAVAAALWLADKATGGIVSDYAKKVIRKKVLKLKDETDTLRQELTASRQTYDSVVGKVEELLEANDALLAEVLKLRVENDRLSKELAAARAARK